MSLPPSEGSTRVEFTVPKQDARLRLDLFLAKELPAYSRSRIQQLIRAKFANVNGSPARPSDIVRAGDRVDIIEPPLE
ncbi:MAG: S4 domain-containing protein, partial [Verrucomicrobiota bacterium]